ncbi:1213_t:CDS:2 [Diversispora eburnea]|uniref:1213_t:CDS:1 n=1 Tax=Diversispora eburnea TaxID=1213867 RepID=A0A9N9G4K0_9GLOM|nr:1213_t:CDS:2 [Diversispora eburnea]
MQCAAYNLTYDCDNLADTCLLKYGSNSCNEQYEACKNNRTTSCDIQTIVFKDWNPTFFQWTGDLFNSICKTSDVLCAAWHTVCQKSGNACEFIRDACKKKDIPDKVLECLWENNEGSPIKKQLEDVGSDSVVFCHGKSVRRALGADLDSIFSDIKKFMEDNPNEILNIAFGDYDGSNATFIANFIQNKLEYYFVNGTGYSLMLQEKNGWPKLKEMIEINQRIVIWFGDLYSELGSPINTRKDWIHSIDSYFIPSYTYTAGDLTAQQLNESFIGWSNNVTTVIDDDKKNYGYIRWQAIDATVGLGLIGLEDSLKNNTNPGNLCLKDLANKTNYEYLDYFFDIFKDKFDHIIRVTLDFYPQSNLFDVVDKLNQLNVQNNRTIEY